MSEKQIVQSPRSRFVHVMCKKCKHEQVIYNKAATQVVCNNCGERLANSTGGEIEVIAKVLEVLS